METYINHTNFNNKVKTIQENTSTGLGRGNISVISTNTNPVFFRPMLEWLEKSKHKDLKPYLSSQKRKVFKSKKYYLLTEEATTTTWKLDSTIIQKTKKAMYLLKTALKKLS